MCTRGTGSTVTYRGDRDGKRHRPNQDTVISAGTRTNAIAGTRTNAIGLWSWSPFHRTWACHEDVYECWYLLAI